MQKYLKIAYNSILGVLAALAIIVMSTIGAIVTNGATDAGMAFPDTTIDIYYVVCSTQLGFIIVLLCFENIKNKDILKLFASLLGIVFGVMMFGMILFTSLIFSIPYSILGIGLIVISILQLKVIRNA